MPMPMTAACVPPLAEEGLLLQYYLEGVEAVPWIAGLSAGAGAQSKEADHLYCAAGPSAISELLHRAYVTQDAIDLTPFSTMYVDWAVVRPNSGSVSFGVATVRDDSSFVASVARSATQARTEESLDVSALSGLHYLKLRATRTGALVTATEGFFYGVRFEV
jgi:hypothetical protein